ncbi:MAG: GSU2403 family nucleotidyltransferase fold protein [Deltaproteobacteria bacterium]|nr:GSU2403 family nucleotidyltransferase fold protein [Deltaproteobacteria bacterium]
MSLFTIHARALTSLYADVEGVALTLHSPLLGTPGSVVERTNASGFRFYSHQFYNGDGKKTERYIAGPVGAPEADAAAEAVRQQLVEVKDLVPSLRLLGREGFNLVDAKTYATLASLAKHGVFTAGATLIGSHAYGIILNRLGVRGVPYATEDIDIARNEALAFAERPSQGFLEMLKSSGIDFVEVPGLDPRTPATSFKQKGRGRFHVDLLVPSRTDDFPVVEVPELAAHATGLPYLDYLLAESQMAMLAAREGCCPVRVPLAERFCVHKLLVSALRTGRDAKSQKDVFQAAVLAAALAELEPGALASAKEALPKRAEKLWRRGMDAVAKHIEFLHPRAWEELQGAAHS